MTNEEGYNYDEFIKKPFIIKQADDDMNYQQGYSTIEGMVRQSTSNPIIKPSVALGNVLEIAKSELAKLIDQRKGAEDTLTPLGHKLSPPTEINKLQESIKVLEDHHWHWKNVKER
jgi:hypothetical protein